MDEKPTDNELLNAFPDDRKTKFFPQLKRVNLPLGEVIYESGQTLDSVYFPTNSIISLLYVTENGSSAEISVVGNEGIVGIAVFMGGGSTPNRAVVHCAGSAYRLPASVLRKEFNSVSEIRLILLRYT